MDLPLGGLGAIVAAALLYWIAATVRRRRQERRRQTIVEERTRIARDLHDVVAQGLTAITFQVENARSTLDDRDRCLHCLDAIAALARATSVAIERLLLDLRPPDLVGQAFDAAVRQMLTTVLDGVSIQASVTVRGTARALPPTVEDQLFRIVQEAVTNVLRHAQARWLEVELDYTDAARFRLAVRDDGGGPLSSSAPSAAGRGSGIAAMRARTHAMGGHFALVASAAGGVEVRVDIST